VTYDIQKAKFNREKFYFVELFLPYCELSYGVAPCTAAGGPKCYNTYASCQDRENYDPEPKVYRFCSARSPQPSGLPNFTLPTVTAVTFTAPSVDVTGGLGVRASVAVTMADAPSADIGIDKYVTERTYIPHHTGSYFGKLRARNPFYEDSKLIVYSGFLEDDGSFNIDSFQQRVYVVSAMQVGNGKAKLEGRDPLKLAEGLKAQYPAKSAGALSVDMSDSATTATLIPAGVGDSYTTEGWVRISAEVMAFTRVGDVLTLTRGQYNTAAAAHDEGDAVQLCARENDRIDNLLFKLLTVGAALPADVIPTAEWADEAGANYPGDLDRLITSPEAVDDLIKELCETAPSYIYWDERFNLIRFEAVKAPFIGGTALNEADNFTGSLTYADQLKLRASRVIIYFGQIDPTKDRDEISNYAQTYIRADLDSEAAAGSPAIRTIYSRWLNNFNKAGAVLAATRLGRRFAQAPRLLNFTMTSKDSSYWLGSRCIVEHSELQQFDGSAGTVPAQIVSVAEKPAGYVYGALETYWGPALPDDAEDDISYIILGGDLFNVNLRTVYDSLFPEPTGESIVRFLVDTSVEVGSTSTSTYSMDTGLWPVGMPAVQLGVRGYVQGRGGDAPPVVSVVNGRPGGHALRMQHPITIIEMTGIIGGGGGGGGSALSARGGGGAGIPGGAGQPSGSRSAGGVPTENATPPPNDFIFAGGAGGDIGEDGSEGYSDIGSVGTGGAAGLAIDTGGYALTARLYRSFIGGVSTSGPSDFLIDRVSDATLALLGVSTGTASAGDNLWVRVDAQTIEELLTIDSVVSFGSGLWSIKFTTLPTTAVPATGIAVRLAKEDDLPDLIGSRILGDII